MKEQKKNAAVVKGLLVLLMCVILSTTLAPKDVYAGAWRRNSSGWWYSEDNGSWPRSAWKYINGKWYYFNGGGYMTTGWQLVGGRWYYMNGSGAMTTGWQLVKGKWYYMNNSGAMLTGWQFVSGKWYYMNNSGAMLTGWQRVSGKWYYMNGSGAMLTGWQQINGNYYYMNRSGAMQANTWIDGRYVKSDGAWDQSKTGDNTSTKNVTTTNTDVAAMNRSYDRGMATEIINRINDYRASQGLGTLSISSLMSSYADTRAYEISSVFDHVRPNGTYANQSMSGLRGENIAYGQTSATEVVNAWKNSPSHNANLLDGSYTSVGVTVYQKAGTWGETNYIALVFQ